METKECDLCGERFQRQDRGNVVFSTCRKCSLSEGPPLSAAFDFLSESPEDWELDAGMIGEVL